LQDASRIRIYVEVQLEDPRIHTAEIRGVGKSIETEVEQPKKILEGVGKGLKKLF